MDEKEMSNMKFNLKAFAKKDVQDDHKLTERKLQKDRKDAPEELTEKQLDKDKVPEKDELTEKLLERTRTGGADIIIEKNLDDSKSKLVQHRNTSAYDGDINKLEEQRLAKGNVEEDETAKPASEYPKKERWWEHLKASSKKKVITAAGMSFEEDSERWSRLPETWTEEEGVSVDPLVPPDDFAIEEIGTEPLILDTIKPIDTPVAKGLFVSFDVAPDAQMGEAELQEAAYNKLIEEGYEYLAGIPDFNPMSFRVNGDKVTARLIGDEYFPVGKGEFEGESLADESPFSVSDLQPTDVEGIVIGTVTIDPDMIEMVQDMDDDEIRQQVMDAIVDSHEGVSVESDGIDIDNLAEGKISFVGETSASTPSAPEIPEEAKAVFTEKVFDIVILSDTKKN